MHADERAVYIRQLTLMFPDIIGVDIEKRVVNAQVAKQGKGDGDTVNIESEYITDLIAEFDIKISKELILEAIESGSQSKVEETVQKDIDAYINGEVDDHQKQTCMDDIILACMYCVIKTADIQGTDDVYPYSIQKHLKEVIDHNPSMEYDELISKEVLARKRVYTDTFLMSGSIVDAYLLAMGFPVMEFKESQGMDVKIGADDLGKWGDMTLNELYAKFLGRVYS